MQSPIHESIGADCAKLEVARSLSLLLLDQTEIRQRESNNYLTQIDYENNLTTILETELLKAQ